MTAINFSDITNHWARPFIEALAAKGILAGFPDGTFKPNQIVNRAQYAAVLNQAFKLPTKRAAIQFKDVAPNYWAAPAIKRTYEMGLLAGYPSLDFRPLAGLTKAQLWVSLVNGLEIQYADAVRIDASKLYQDWETTQNYARTPIAIATGRGLVVNYPNLKALEPNRPATRAEVAAILYQALVAIGQVSPIASPYIVPPPTAQGPTTVKVSHTREFRAVWVATVWNLDWPSQSSLTTQQQQQELLKIIQTAADLNLNAVILQVRSEGDALYPSSLEPWSHWLTGTQGRAPNPAWDPLAFAVDECHKRNLEFHAWFNPYRAKTSASTQLGATHIMRETPSAVYNYGSQAWMDPGLQVVQDRTYAVILDVLNRYDVDGIHLDDYFYPYPVEGQAFPDSKTYDAYRSGGGTLSASDWRRDNVNKMVRRLKTGITAAKPHVKFGISPFGIYRPGQPPGITGMDQYETLYADPKKWLAEGWVDYIAPQLYWRIDQVQQSYPTLLKWWTENNPKGAHVYPGNNLARLGQPSWTFDEFKNQVSLTRQMASKLALGNIYFSMQTFSSDRDGIVAQFQQQIYPKPALVPTLASLKAPAPKPPADLKVNNGTLSWTAVTDGSTRAWTLYRRESNGWQLVDILAGTRTSTTRPAGTYALCGVNRVGEESEGVVATV
ncbi:family 10 glycosylhydrolase [Oscillatoria sp. FACHB-1406]|uniref:glycoside hydrolase family 10 protein n=1 Tax=Oscillatoria sp. FACHB-1406 TaxID=2692846 RepID=UPI001684BA0C|nr:family 10 glycosylhydrolase [Oscillatoria sp. FACHB-1406]MBD2579948.1 family 10 glycosylhydrolase [Oscillatoria sp. FACHB-1406]